jgi:hypothetical protein
VGWGGAGFKPRTTPCSLGKMGKWKKKTRRGKIFFSEMEGEERYRLQICI